MTKTKKKLKLLTEIKMKTENIKIIKLFQNIEIKKYWNNTAQYIFP